MGMFRDSKKCLGTYNGLKPINESEISSNTLGGHCSNEIVDIDQTILSLHGVEDSISWVLRWASDRYIWVPSWP